MLYEELFQISKVLLAEGDDERTPEVLLRRIVERCGAETGFVVVRKEGRERPAIGRCQPQPGGSAPQALDCHVNDGGSDKQTTDRIKRSKVLLGNVRGDSAHFMRSGDDAQGANRRQAECFRGSSYREIVGQQHRHRQLPAEQQTLPLSCLKPLQPMVQSELRDFDARQGVPLREGEHFSDRRRPRGLVPDALGDMELLKDREKRQATDFCEMDQWARVGDCG